MNKTISLIRRIEEASLNAWPAHHCLVDQGWLLRFADGYTRRSNSVNPIYAVEAEGASEVIERVVRCEAHYRAYKQPTIFKLTPLTQPTHLDELLAARGYVHEAPTMVRQRSLADPMPLNEIQGVVQIEDTISDTWIKDFTQFSDLKDGQVAALRGILQNIVPTTGYATLRVNGEVVSCGLAVVEGTIVGLYDIVTAIAARGRGYGVHMLAALLAWSKAQGATLAYLQVMNNNLPAKRLYDKLGFTELYPYWYRVQRG
jgi:N-acetylglutamate synthase